MDALIQTAKGQHIRTADVLRSAAKLLRMHDRSDTSAKRRMRYAAQMEGLADEIDRAERGANVGAFIEQDTDG